MPQAAEAGAGRAGGGLGSGGGRAALPRCSSPGAFFAHREAEPNERLKLRLTEAYEGGGRQAAQCGLFLVLFQTQPALCRAFWAS